MTKSITTKDNQQTTHTNTHTQKYEKLKYLAIVFFFKEEMTMFSVAVAVVFAIVLLCFIKIAIQTEIDFQ